MAWAFLAFYCTSDSRSFICRWAIGRTPVGLDSWVRAVQQTESTEQKGLTQPVAPTQRKSLMPFHDLGWAYTMAGMANAWVKLGINRDASSKAEGSTVGLWWPPSPLLSTPGQDISLVWPILSLKNKGVSWDGVQRPFQLCILWPGQDSPQWWRLTKSLSLLWCPYLSALFSPIPSSRLIPGWEVIQLLCVPISILLRKVVDTGVSQLLLIDLKGTHTSFVHHPRYLEPSAIPLPRNLATHHLWSLCVRDVC